MGNALREERYHGNGFTYLRLLFALCVLYVHSFAFGTVREPVWEWSNGKLAVSGIAVDGFFVISGFLVWRSMRTSSGPWSYLAKRGLRLLPALVTVMVLSVLVGAFITSLDPSDYWTRPQVWYFLTNPFWMLRGGLHFDLPGVFEDLPIRAINASLWTIPYEIFFYWLLVLPFVLPRRSKWLVPILLLVFLGSLVLNHMDSSYTLPRTSFELDRIAKLAPFFMGGALIAQAQWEKWLARPSLLGTALVVLALATVFMHRSDVFWYVLLPPLVIGFAYLPFWSTMRGSGPDDISYGVYLSGWPIQQLLFYNVGIAGWSMFAVSTILACAYGYLSWKLVEAPTLLLKRSLPPLRSEEANDRDPRVQDLS